MAAGTGRAARIREGTDPRAGRAGRPAPSAADGPVRQRLPLRLARTGPNTLLDLFGDQPQLVTTSSWTTARTSTAPAAPSSPTTCRPTCSGLLAEGGASLAMVSNMPLAQIESYKARMGWTVPFVSSRGTASPTTAAPAVASCSASSCATATPSTAPTTPRLRGVDRLVFANSILDLTVLRPAGGLGGLAARLATASRPTARSKRLRARPQLRAVAVGIPAGYFLRATTDTAVCPPHCVNSRIAHRPVNVADDQSDSASCGSVSPFDRGEALGGQGGLQAVQHRGERARCHTLDHQAAGCRDPPRW